MLTDRWPLATAAEMRALDRHTTSALGVPGELLMESAGQALAAQALRLLPERGGEVWAYCGAGNNGGDGFVVARLLQLRGVRARIVLVADRARFTPEAAANFARAERAGVALAKGAAPRGSVIVDAIFGIGLARKVEGALARAIRRINASRPSCRVLAVDVPSGVDADTGQVHGVAVQADVTLTIGLPKLGLTQEPARSLAGEIVVARIGIADAAPGVALAAECWTRAAAARALPARPRAGHKGSFGHVLIAGGSRGKAGAAALAARGAARGGAGLVTVACPRGQNAILQRTSVEAMTAPLAESGRGTFARAAEEELLELARARGALVLGPGCGRDAETRAALRAFALAAPGPLVLDADGLVAFEGRAGELRGRRAPTLLTPHPGEAGLLLGLTPRAVNAARPALARELAKETGAVVVLKGAGSAIAAPDGALAVNPTGGPVLGTGGTGDVLAGLAGALLAQRVPIFEAAALATFVHGAAGDLVASRRGSRGSLASEIADAIPEALRELAAPQREIGAGDAIRFPQPG
ncbi:MAG TPA: NAD(P)H-hydrate dehydratase [Myxococcota bacterium]|nr:NAD(P)H-hydrate dehydratase [Myxococcota bacterium]